MKLSRIACFAAVLAMTGATVFADGLVKFKDWNASPQGYFMTKAERDQWSVVKTDADAQQFVDKFLASRGPGFAEEVANRADQADKHLTLGKLPGSKTLRGKLIVVFGPPSALETPMVADTDSSHTDSPLMAGVLTGGTAGGVGGGKGDGGSESTGAKTMVSGRVMQHYHMTFATTPSGPLDVTVVADPNNGKDRPKSREDAKKLETAFEAAAQASIKSK
jgi:GWxTD domain-containing protein